MQGLADTAAAGDAAPNSSSDESESSEDEVSSQGRSADGSELISSLENRGYAYESASASSDDGFVSVCCTTSNVPLHRCLAVCASSRRPLQRDLDVLPARRRS